MELNALISHSVNLFKIVIKSYQPADKVVNDYIRAKKYIGSSERKFISETVYSALRIYYLADYCFNYYLKELSNLTIENEKDMKEFGIILTTIILTEKYHAFGFNSSKELISKLNKRSSKDFNTNLELIVESNLKINNETARNFVEGIIESYSKIVKEVHDISTSSNHLDKSSLLLFKNRLSIQEWIISEWLNNELNKYNLDKSLKLAESLLQPANIGIRISSKFDRKDIIDKLTIIGAVAEPGLHSPNCINLNKRFKLTDTDLFKNGMIEIQDEGSQLISLALNPRPGMRVLDACAGAGGKSIHLADLQNDKGDIVSTDIEFSRLKEISKRAQRLGLKSIKPMLLKKGKEPQELKKGFDYILVDAPCSGIGTARRMPLVKYRLTPKLLKKHSDNQKSILQFYSKYLRPQGILVYSTCSLMQEENEGVIQHFINENPDFSTSDLYETFKAQGIEIPGMKPGDYCVTLFPSVHGTDGFFMARLIKD